MLRIDELVDMAGCNKPKVFSSLDLMIDYHQVKMAEDSNIAILGSGECCLKQPMPWQPFNG